MKKILIIENSPLDVRMLKDILKDDYEVVSSHSATEGIEMARGSEPLLVLLDMKLPSADGFAVLARLKELIETKDIPVIMMSNSNNAAGEEMCILAGAVDYFAKPFMPGVVRARVKTHVELYLLRKKLAESATTDSLTRVPNRRGFDERVLIEWAHAMRSGSPLSFAIIDVDAYKGYNDFYGHLKGDDALRLIATEAEHQLTRRTDFFARYGGDEFVLLLPSTMSDGGKRVAEAIRGAIEGLKIPLTVSIGGATVLAGDDNSFEELFNEADRMLYAAKNEGRNLVRWTS